LEEGGTTVGIPPTEHIESKIWTYGMCEGDFFDFLAVRTSLIDVTACQTPH
jgi:CO dehydrogenase maturation factor